MNIWIPEIIQDRRDEQTNMSASVDTRKTVHLSPIPIGLITGTSTLDSQLCHKYNTPVQWVL